LKGELRHEVSACELEELFTVPDLPDLTSPKPLRSLLRGGGVLLGIGNDGIEA
jgi:hypothetical protein